MRGHIGLTAISCVGALAIAGWRTDYAGWISGRLNGAISMATAYAGCAALALVATGTLMASARKAENKRDQKRGVVVVLSVCLMLTTVVLRSKFGNRVSAFREGFSEWAAENVDRTGIAEWLRHTQGSGQEVPPPYWFPAQHTEFPLGYRIDPSRYPAVIRRLNPDQVQLVRVRQTVVLGWRGTDWGSIRLLVINLGDSGAPSELVNDMVEWRRLSSQVAAGFVEVH